LQLISITLRALEQYSLQYFSFCATVQLQLGCAHFFLFFSSAIAVSPFGNSRLIHLPGGV